MTMQRDNPFSGVSITVENKNKLGAGDFQVVGKKPMTQSELVVATETAAKNGFTGGAQVVLKSEAVKPQRRFRTGRNQQINIKATDQTIQKFYKLADDANITLGELLERALTALEEKISKIEN